MDLIGYVRVSTEGQRDNTSIDEQIKRLQMYCAAYSHTLTDIYKDVATGATADSRPEYQKALQALKRVDGLISTRLDRIARNTRDVLHLVEDILQPKDKALVLLDLNIDTSTPTGKLILTVMAAVAALERDLIRERTQSGRRAKAANGGYAFGTPAYGWKAENKRLVPCNTEQAVLHLIRQLHLRRRLKASRIVDHLNNLGIPSKFGRKWSIPQIIRILERPDDYCPHGGLPAHNGEENHA